VYHQGLFAPTCLGFLGRCDKNMNDLNSYCAAQGGQGKYSVYHMLLSPTVSPKETLFIYFGYVVSFGETAGDSDI
jgi:hypothetical protein